MSSLSLLCLLFRFGSPRRLSFLFPLVYCISCLSFQVLLFLSLFPLVSLLLTEDLGLIHVAFRFRLGYLFVPGHDDDSRLFVPFWHTASIQQQVCGLKTLISASTTPGSASQTFSASSYRQDVSSKNTRIVRPVGSYCRGRTSRKPRPSRGSTQISPRQTQWHRAQQQQQAPRESINNNRCHHRPG